MTAPLLKHLQRRIFSSLLLAATSAFADSVDYPQPLVPASASGVPHALAGQLLFQNGDSFFIGSGVVVKPRSVLTAAHNLWDAENGFSTDVLFRRGLTVDSTLTAQSASRIYVLSGYRENARKFSGNDARTFSTDTGALVFRTPVAAGAAAGWWANPELLTSAAPALALGYGGEFHTGSDLLGVSPESPSHVVVGSFLENRSVYFESGMSGGPVFVQSSDGRWFVAGLIVAGSREPVSGGLRALDASVADFIREYLK